MEKGVKNNMAENGNGKRPNGRPKIEIDWKNFDKLCTIQCNLEEIAAWFECSVDTIERAVKREKKMGFAEYVTIKRGKGKVGLRRKQYQTAMAGNVTMLIWLGKQELGQKDRSHIEETGENGEPIKITVVDA
jgi:hypothetical protein